MAHRSNFWTSGDPLPAVPAETMFSVAEMFGESGTIAVAPLDGSALPDEDAVFDAFRQAFRFPAWFGWNWDALSDCLRDLSWLPADRFLVLVDNSDDVLAGDADARQEFFAVLRRAAQQWANPLTSRRHTAVPFKVVLVRAESVFGIGRARRRGAQRRRRGCRIATVMPRRLRAHLTPSEISPTR
ncbi:barstar family protein [Actinoplanes sp. N902-109]|uniref:barstar family protein n=1 Tax=Actinoplanes sp. (strain N902-109) TaxID=649831 RepID=UPI0003293569|nr:barstar family protein [Actinoplanes sp. N902-109]AGL19007.1 hypothetical protein L083_5497 [Actinoplanes sp. N902-109]